MAMYGTVAFADVSSSAHLKPFFGQEVIQEDNRTHDIVRILLIKLVSHPALRADNNSVRPALVYKHAEIHS